MTDETSSDDLAGENPPLARLDAGAETGNPPRRDPAGRSGEHGFREGTRAGGEDSRDTRPDRATRFIETAQGILSYTELAPLLAERVARVEFDLYENLAFAAFAEGRFLTIHPFRDFNGRTIRVFLLEILRRLDLPRVQLAPQTDDRRAEYFTALEAADRHDWKPLMAIWQQRFHEAPAD